MVSTFDRFLPDSVLRPSPERSGDPLELRVGAPVPFMVGAQKAACAPWLSSLGSSALGSLLAGAWLGGVPNVSWVPKPPPGPSQGYVLDPMFGFVSIFGGNFFEVFV